MIIGKNWNKEEALHYAKNVWERAVVHEKYVAWRKNHIESQRFYDGHDIFLNSDLQKLKKLNILGISANLISPIIDNLTGIELQSRYKIKAEVDSDSPEAANLSSAVTSFLIKIQEAEDSDKENASSLKDGCIGGLGWIMVSKFQDRTFIEKMHPLEMIPDFDDVSPHFTKMEYVLRMIFMSEQEMRSRWGKKLETVNFSSFNTHLSPSPAVMNLTAEYPFFDKQGSMNCVCEIQFKVPRKAFTGLTREGRHFETFDLDKAEDVVERKSSIEEIDAKEIRRLLFCQNTVLEYSPLDPSYPNQRDFSYIPFVYKKRGDNVPYGMVENLKAMQIDFNARLTKMLRSYTSERTFIKNASLDTKDSIKKQKERWSDPNAVIALASNEDVVFSRATEMGDNQAKMIEGYLNLIKKSSGVEDESMGRQTNATSGISQKMREVTSLRTNSFIFDNYNLFKKRQGLQLVNIIQHSFTTNIYTTLENEDEKEAFYLNFTYEDSLGNVKIDNDISFMPFSIVIEEIPTFKTTLDARRLSLETIASLPFQEYVWMSEELLRLYTDKPKKLKEEIMNAKREMAILQNPQAFQQAQEAPQLNQPQGILANVTGNQQ